MVSICLRTLRDEPFQRARTVSVSVSVSFSFLVLRPGAPSFVFRAVTSLPLLRRRRKEVHLPYQTEGEVRQPSIAFEKALHVRFCKPSSMRDRLREVHTPHRLR